MWRERRPQYLSGLDAAHLGHVAVHHHQVDGGGAVRRELGEALEAVFRLRDVEHQTIRLEQAGLQHPRDGGVLHEQNALRRFHHLEKRREESGLARACASTDEEGQPRVDDGPQPQSSEFVDGSEAHEVGQVEAAPVRDAQGDQCAVR